MRYHWPLASDNFTILDKLAIAQFFLTSKQWTQGNRVEEFERAMADLCGYRHAVFVSSGSTANTLLAMWLRDSKPTANRVLVPMVTWPTSVAPWIREGFEVVFIGVSISDFCMNLELAARYIEEHPGEVACVFPTSLLGFTPDQEKLDSIRRMGPIVMVDNCEATLSKMGGSTSTTSTYFSHHIQSIEGGFVLTNDLPIYEYCRINRNHGMTRGTSKAGFNPSVDKRFEFASLGSNFRNCDGRAVVGLLDLKRAKRYAAGRVASYERFRPRLDASRYHTPPLKNGDVPFALPIVARYSSPARDAIIALCDRLSIETRPIVAGNMMRQEPYRSLFRHDTGHPKYGCGVAEMLNNNGLYVGLGSSPSHEQIDELASSLNKLP